MSPSSDNYYYPYTRKQVVDWMRELREDDLIAELNTLNYKASRYLDTIPNSIFIEKISFIDFYETLAEEDQIKIQFSSALKRIVEFDFTHSKKIRRQSLITKEYEDYYK